MFAIKETIKSKLPTPRMPQISKPQMPSVGSMKESITSKMPSLPQIPAIGEYLPELPSMPEVPLPEPLENAKLYVQKFNDENVCSLLKTTNSVMIILSLLAMVGLSDYLIFKPNMIINIVKESESESKWHIPYLWTLITSTFAEQNIFTLGLFLYLANYIAIRNRESLEEAWEPRDFTRMLVIAGGLSTSSLLLLRVTLFAINNDDKVYSGYEFSSTNIVVISLLLGLQQCSHRSFTAAANPIVFGS